MSIWELIKVLIFTDTSLKIRNANQFVMRTFFSILDLTRTEYTFKLKEGMHIKWKMVKILPKQTGKMYFALDSCIEKNDSVF